MHVMALQYKVIQTACLAILIVLPVKLIRQIVLRVRLINTYTRIFAMTNAHLGMHLYKANVN